MYDERTSGAWHLNTPRLVANDQGQAVWRWDQQEPFGVSVPDENPSGLGAFEFPLRFPGQYADKESNLFYNYFRDYDPALGRYVKSDPVGLAGGLSTFAYAASNPLSFTDRLGLITEPPEIDPNELACKKCDELQSDCQKTIGGYTNSPQAQYACIRLCHIACARYIDNPQRLWSCVGNCSSGCQNLGQQIPQTVCQILGDECRRRNCKPKPPSIALCI